MKVFQLEVHPEVKPIINERRFMVKNTYSKVPNKRGGSNEQGGWKFV